MSKASLESEVRQKYYKLIYDFLESIGEQPMATGAGACDIPIVSEDGEEGFVSFKVTVPRGKRVEGTYKPYDGYEVHEAWKEELEIRENKKQVAAENKARVAAEKERKKKSKAV